MLQNILIPIACESGCFGSCLISDRPNGERKAVNVGTCANEGCLLRPNVQKQLDSVILPSFLFLFWHGTERWRRKSALFPCVTREQTPDSGDSIQGVDARQTDDCSCSSKPWSPNA